MSDEGRTDAATMIADLLGSGHAVQFEARGDSMDPLIRDRDYLHVEPCDQVRAGDIVLVLAARGLTAHRVIANRDGMVTTRGDNAPAPDDPVPRDKVLGKVTAVIRDGREMKLKNLWSAATASRRFRFFVRQALRRAR